MDKVLGVGALLVFQQTAHPLIAALVTAALTVLLVLPVGGNAVFGDFVHLLGADLHLEGDGVIAHDRGVQALVHIGLRRADIILEAAQNGLIQIVHDAQHIVAVKHRIHDHAEGKQVEHIVQILVLRIHLAVDAVGVLHAAADTGLDARLVQTLRDLAVDGGHKAVILRRLFVQSLRNFTPTDGVEILQAQILQLPLHLLHTQTVGKRGIDLHGLKGLLLLLGRGLILHGAHIVQPVGDLDKNDADVLAHGKQHLAQIFHLLLFLGGKLHAGQLADALHQIRHGGGKQTGHIFMGNGSVLDGIVEQGGLNGLAVQMQLLGKNLRHRQRMGHIGRAVLPALVLMGTAGIVKRRTDLRKIRAGIIAANGLLQPIIHFIRCHTAPPPFASRIFCRVRM